MNNFSTPPPTVACPEQVLWCEESFRSNVRFSALAGAVSFSLAGLTAVLGNVLVFVVYYQNESLRRPANTILLNLASVDFLTGAIVYPVFICEQIMILTSDCSANICVVQELKILATYFFASETLVTLSLCSLDRYLAVFHSFRYAELVTDERVKKLLLASWLGLVFFVVATTDLGYGIPSAMLLYVSNVIFISVAYHKIYKEIRRLENDPVVVAHEMENARKERERKTVKTLGLVLGLLLLSHVPIICYFLYRMVSEKFFHIEGTAVLTYKLRLMACFFLLSNSTLNVFVYFWTISEFREALSKLFRPITTRFSNDVAPAWTAPIKLSLTDAESKKANMKRQWNQLRGKKDPVNLLARAWVPTPASKISHPSSPRINWRGQMPLVREISNYLTGNHKLNNVIWN